MLAIKWVVWNYKGAKTQARSLYTPGITHSFGSEQKISGEQTKKGVFVLLKLNIKLGYQSCKKPEAKRLFRGPIPGQLLLHPCSQYPSEVYTK